MANANLPVLNATIDLTLFENNEAADRATFRDVHNLLVMTANFENNILHNARHVGRELQTCSGDLNTLSNETNLGFNRVTNTYN